MSDPIRLGEGSRLDRYVIVRRLGAGAMGEVYLADDPQIGRRLAVKTVRVEEGRAQEIADRKLRLLREARAAGKLLHPNVVTLFDAGEDRDVLYLAFEFVEGSDLSVRLTEGAPLTVAEALGIVRQAAAALDYAHHQGVIHRDIKPSNLMLTADGRVKVADFGIAKVIDQTSDLTMTGSVVGSPHYLSPEQIRGDDLDGRTDVFSLGVLLYEILGRKKPFEADTLTTLVYRILNQEPAPIGSLRSDLGPRLQKLVSKMLEKDRHLRFASAGDVVREIESCERELEPSLLASQASPVDDPTQATVRMVAPAPAVIAAATPPTPPPPPAPAAAVVPPAVPGVAPATDSTAFSPPRAPRSRLALVASVVAAFVLLLIVAGLGARRWTAGRAETATPTARAEGATTATADGEKETEPVDLPSTVASTTQGAPSDSRESTEPAPGAAEPNDSAAAAVSQEPSFQPGERARPSFPAGTTPAAPREEASDRPAAPPSDPVPAAKPRSQPAPTPEPEPVAAEPEPAPAERAAVEDAPTPREEIRDAIVERIPVAREMATGMSLSFEILPKEVAERLVVRLDRIVIGRAADWNAKKRGGRAYAIAEPGLHILTFLVDGTDVYRIRIDARPGNPSPSSISVDLPQFARRGRRPGGR